MSGAPDDQAAEFCRRIVPYQMRAAELPEAEREIFLATAAARVWAEIDAERVAEAGA